MPRLDCKTGILRAALVEVPYSVEMTLTTCRLIMSTVNSREPEVCTRKEQLRAAVGVVANLLDLLQSVFH